MAHDYTLFIDNLKKRRYDEALKEYALSDAFKKAKYPKSVLYTLESMQEIDNAFAYKVYANSRKIHQKLEKALAKRGYKNDYRYQGALKTYSNIMLYGDVEIMVIKKNLDGNTHKEIQKLAADILDVLSDSKEYASVHYNDKTRIRVTATKPTCEIDILPTVWVDSTEYKKSKNEIYRGVAEFDFKQKKVKKYLPFLNMARFNSKDQHTNGNLKRLTRLLTSLRIDVKRIYLTDPEINAMLYHIPEKVLSIDPKHVLHLLPYVSKLLFKLASDPDFFSKLPSPSGKDRVFASSPTKQADIKKLNEALEELIDDLKQELALINRDLNSVIHYP